MSVCRSVCPCVNQCFLIDIMAGAGFQTALMFGMDFLYIKTFLHEYSCWAPSTMNNYILSRLYIEQSNHL